jgi:hypothetical protein
MYANHPHTTEQAIPKGKSRKDKRYVSIVPGTYAGNKRNLTTDELAAQLGLNPQSIRRRYSQTGSYFQLRPIKLPNRRLLWPANALEQLSRSE